MNFRKFISGVSALAIAASAFAGMAVTASAAGTTNLAVNAEKSTSSETSELRVNQTVYSFIKFDGSAIKSSGEVITSATLKLNVASRGYNSKRSRWEDTQLNTSYIDDSKKAWDGTSAIVWGDYTKNAIAAPWTGTKTSAVAQDGVTPYVPLEIDVTNAFKDDADGVITFAFNTSSGREHGIELGTSKLTVETSAIEPANVTFSSNAANTKVVVDNADVSNGGQYIPGTYTYIASAPGYETVTDTFTVASTEAGANKTVSITLTAIAAAPANTNSTAAKAKDETLFSSAFVNSGIALPISLVAGENGAIEFDIYVPVKGSVNFAMGGGSNNGTGPNVRFTENNGTITVDYNSTGSTWPLIGTYPSGQWAHVKIDFTMVEHTSADSTGDRLGSFDVTVTAADNTSISGSPATRNLAPGFNNGNRNYTFSKIDVIGGANVANSEIYVLTPAATATLTSVTNVQPFKMGSDGEGNAVTAAILDITVANQSTAIDVTYKGDTQTSDTKFVGSVRLGVIVPGIVEDLGTSSFTVTAHVE